ncbi:alpha/beta hydrolase [Salegentibacter salinarum]|uniref:Alpha/beta hydrolase n=1 Tax=Salegentibacter salinarum TaxID=447422 RepID=A0A2N0U349_9FLAO|nr:alpha/beta fold hydrolase [Salegentibacter salinarum]PKD21415.1 alpha/beta hydrolase [Salegentibacter salinarum]SKB39033.1 Pimeloyl-ACP methyl ester carboxylesterase [Salegentibacter salinarum]
MKITYKNTQISFTSQGTGNPLVLLHGFLESKEIWKDFAEELSVKRQVICIDLPGHGESGNISEVHSMAEMAETVKSVLDELEIKKASFAGHSMGGYVSLEFQNIFPTMCNSLVLVNSTPQADSEERKANRDRAVALVLKNKRAFVSMAISNLLTPENNKIFKSQIEELKNRALKFSTEGIYAAIKGMKIRTDHTGLFAKFNGQKIIIAGKQDSVMDFNTIKAIAIRCESEFESLPGGHLAFLENKDNLSKILHFID